MKKWYVEIIEEMTIKVGKIDRVIDSLRSKVKERDYVIQKLEEVLMLKNKLEKTIVEEDIHSKVETK